MQGHGARREGSQGGHYYEPTVLIDVTNDMQVAREEVFGPVLAVIRHNDDDDGSVPDVAGRTWDSMSRVPRP